MLNLVILAGGESKRFVGSRWDVPKQFIKFSVDGKPDAQMWENSSIHHIRYHSRAFVVLRAEHAGFVQRPVSRRAEPIWLHEPTIGQAETLLAALAHIGLGEFLVVNCDQGFSPYVLDMLIEQGRTYQIPVALTFAADHSEENRWSYVNAHPVFTWAAEKSAVGPMALAGAYYFPSLDYILEPTRRLVEAALRDGTEPYISQIYGDIPGPKISLRIRRDQWYDWGTPTALERFLQENEHPTNS